VTGDTALRGITGTVLWWEGGRGEVHVHGENWQARADRPLAPGQRVRVVGRDRLILTVEPENGAAGGPAPPSEGRT